MKKSLSFKFGERHLSEKARFCVIEIADIFQKSGQQ
jgi:hypothetical protein